jgi:glycosyltransferase involved in cell wall biosynthesis
VIPNGVDLASDPKPIEDRERGLIVAVGRVTAQKNYSVLIEATHLLRGHDLQVNIIGGADLSDEGDKLRGLATRKGVSSIRFVGVLRRDRDQVFERLSMASLFVNCSVHEGMSNSVLEAIQHGTPILLSDITANRDLGLPEIHYFNPKSPIELSTKIARALEAPSVFLADRSRFHDWDEVIDRYRRHMNLPL